MITALFDLLITIIIIPIIKGVFLILESIYDAFKK